MKKIPIDMSSGVPMMDFHLWSRTKGVYRSIFALIDTGATITTLSKDVLILLGYDFTETTKKRIGTASGYEYVDEVYLDKVLIGEFELNNVAVYAHNFPQNNLLSGGVIGMNILSQFEMFISFKRKFMQLTPNEE